MANNKELSILKWAGIALACLSTVFTLAIVGSHLSGRLVGLGKMGIVGTVGAELMSIICAWLAVSERARVAGVAMICQIVLTGILLVNASIALDLDWQETVATKAAERQLTILKQAADEQRKLIETQAEEQRKLIEQQAALAAQLSQQDKRLARDFVKAGQTTSTLPGVGSASNTKPATTTQETKESLPLDVAKLSIYERYGLTVVPLFLALLTVIALGLAAHGRDDNDSSARTTKSSNKAEFRLGKTDDWTDALAELGSAKPPTLASQKRNRKTIPLASQKTNSLASQKHDETSVEIKAPKGKGQKSQTVKISGLTFRVRLSDRGYRVMLLTVEQGRQHEPYLVSFRRPEWKAVEHKSAAFLEKVKEKLRARIVKADDNEAAKLKTLLTTIEEASK